MKRLDIAKSRLAAYGDAHRRQLALAFAADVVTAALLVGSVLVVTDDVTAAEVLAGLGARVVPDDPDAGLNPALEHGVELLREGSDDLAVATVSADLPALLAPDLAAVLGRVPLEGRGFVADLAGTGTTLLAAGPGVALSPAYGPASRSRHLSSGAVELVAPESVRRDVDTPDDLEHAVELGVGPHTLRVLQEIW
ncbi:MAG: cofC2 [Frankiales bacterium]|nr:cofC2 [Frankiales bacterium]